jgi:hypothetical protein
MVILRNLSFGSVYMNYLFCLLLCRQIALVLPYHLTNCGVRTVTCKFARMHDPFRQCLQEEPDEHGQGKWEGTLSVSGADVFVFFSI